MNFFDLKTEEKNYHPNLYVNGHDYFKIFLCKARSGKDLPPGTAVDKMNAIIADGFP